MATTTTPSSPSAASAATANVRTAPDFLDLADSASQKATNQAEINARIEQKKIEHERQRAAQRAVFEAQMAALEAEQKREEQALLAGAPAPGTLPASTAPSTPPIAADPSSNTNLNAIGSGIKSMPSSRRPSGGNKDDLSFHLNKLSITPGSTANNALGGAAAAGRASLDGGARDGKPAQNGNEPFSPGFAGKFVFDDDDSGAPVININPAENPSNVGSFRPSSSSEWPQFNSATSPNRATLSGQVGLPSLDTQTVPLTGRSPTISPSPRVGTNSPHAGTDSSITRSVPGTPQAGFGVGRTSLGGVGAGGLRRELGSPGLDVNGAGGLGETQRGFSNPDLAKAFGRSMGNFQKGDDFGPLHDDFGVVDPNVYQSIGLGNSTRFSQYGAFSPSTDYPGGRAFSPIDKIDGLGGVKHKRAELDREAEFNRFAGTRIEDLQGEILPLCKDQHDPFGNYLCQKLLEFSSDEQRNAICESVADDLVSISLNMHGTRAVQKMIDFLSTPRQIHSIIMALSANVVPLIKDLNGNHVIQKCLNRLVPEDNQFIYNAVAAHCVEVATHRHGCCVLQRCIDHAADSQRVQLVTEITYHGLTLVQDPFGNYVVQYVLDLNDNRFSDAVTRQFIGNVCALSVQKFSSNVIEKCIRVAEPDTRKILIAELLNRNRLEKLLRDSFANYVVQTALDYAEPGQRMLLVECIRPILPMIRNTPYGKRIQSKLQREHMEQNHHHGYGSGNGGGGGGGYNQQAALINLALGGGGMNMMGGGGGGGGGGHQQPIHPHRNIGNPALHHPNALAEAYGQRSVNYNQGMAHHPALQHQQMDHFAGGGGSQVGGYGGAYGGLGGGGGGNLGGAGLGEYGQQQQQQQQQQGGFPYGM
ncbi:armadillo-type protein [Mrakia frigida]|uniref:armadillo-type protein n=1 Tax=Mrakia frigida TaxID=29902 RepID=UPI003FCC0F14